jgi:hypothetical protein
VGGPNIVLGEAIRDYEYMQQWDSKVSKKYDPFLIFPDKHFERSPLLDSNLLGPLPAPKGPDMDVRPFSRSNRKQVLIRAAWAFGGGLAVFGPMLPMVLIKGQAVNLAVTGFAIFACAGILSLPCLHMFGPREVLGITAAYASVWVVFVGTQKIGDFQLPSFKVIFGG